MDIQKLEQIGKIVGAKNVSELAKLISPNSRATFPQLAEVARIMGYTSLDDVYNFANGLKCWLELDGRKDVPLAEVAAVAPSLGAR